MDYKRKKERGSPVGKIITRSEPETVNEVAAEPILDEENELFSQIPVPATQVVSTMTRGRHTLI